MLFKLVGSKSNRMAIGARVTVKNGDVSQMGEVGAGGSYISQNDVRVHFGLGKDDRMPEVEIRWPDGNSERLKDVAADCLYTIVEGKGLVQRAPLPLKELSKKPNK